MKFDPTITLGVLLHLVGLIVSIFAFVRALERRIERRLDEQDEKVLLFHGENKARLDVLDSKVSDLRAYVRAKGVGWTGGGGGC